MHGNAAVNLVDLRPAPSDYLGPARVSGVDGNTVTIDLAGGAVATARLALAYLYEPAPGDVLLVIGRGADHYAIGVLHGTGRARFSLQGDVEIRAEGGALHLVGEKGVTIEGPEVEVAAGKLRMMADAVVQKFTSLNQRVSALLSVRAREVDTVVDETSTTRAKNAVVLTEETMSINGKQIHLG